MLASRRGGPLRNEARTSGSRTSATPSCNRTKASSTSWWPRWSPPASPPRTSPRNTWPRPPAGSARPGWTTPCPSARSRSARPGSRRSSARSATAMSAASVTVPLGHRILLVIPPGEDHTLGAFIAASQFRRYGLWVHLAIGQSAGRGRGDRRDAGLRDDRRLRRRPAGARLRPQAGRRRSSSAASTARPL